MKPNKPYLSLSKKNAKYELSVIVNAVKDQTIASIRQEEVKSGNDKYWGVIITLSDATQLVNGPENPIFSTIVEIALDKSANYKKILCSTEIIVSDGRFGPAAGDSSSIDFSDTNP
ncbi:MAG: hypothetical protein PHP53_17230 [Prolixibacteraceae bacterium]|nr:hypothetical protein [Prolixibacteraceae bacterium]